MPDLKVRVAGAWQSVTTTGPQGPPGPAGSVGAHATTHTPGNTDPIPNVAWTNVANTFSQLNTFSNGTVILGHAWDNKLTAASDSSAISLCGGTAGSSAAGGSVVITGNSYAVGAGKVLIAAGNVASPGGTIEFQTANNLPRGTMHPSGGFSWGSSVDPGVANLSVLSGHVVTGNVRQNATTNVLTLSGGSDIGTSGYINLFGSAYAGFNGQVDIVSPGAAGVSLNAQHAGGMIRFFCVGTERGRMHPSGGFSWGGTTDPGAGAFGTGTNYGVGSNYVLLSSGGVIYIGLGAGGACQAFTTASGTAGTISISGLATAYNTTSDERLKTDRGVLISTDVLQHLTVHTFDWKVDGTTGRGVFAQEAQTVAPFAVTVGTDETDEQGRLTKPWGVDYSKFVPDLIAGWQQHEHKIAALEAKIAKLEAMIEKLLT